MKLYFLSTLIKLAIAKSNNLFDIVYINLESRPDRKDYVEKILKYVNCDFTRFNAVNGSELLNGTKTLEQYTNGLNFNVDLDKYKKLNPKLFGMVGCKFSHQLVWQSIIESKTTKPTLILEDDLDLRRDFVGKLQKSLENQPADWDMVLLSKFYKTPEGAEVDPKNSLVKVNFFYECLAYVVKDAAAAQRMQDLALSDNVTTPIDLVVGYGAQNGKLEVYALEKFQAYQRRDMFGSDIPSSDRLPFLKMADSLFESMKN